jgi:hypothetical protein
MMFNKATTSTGGNGLGMRTMRFRASSIGGGGVSVVCEVTQPGPLAATA